MNPTEDIFNYKILLFQLVIIIILVIIITLILQFKKSVDLEKRISKYGIDSLNNKNISFLDKLYSSIFKFMKKISKILKKSVVINKYSNHYQKYEDKNFNLKKMDYISIKFMLLFSLLILYLLSCVFFLKDVSLFEIFNLLIASYFSVDIYLYIKEKIRIKKIDEDMLKAVIIMNSAYKSGKTTMQAIEIVKNELNGPMGDEFKRMYVDITFGLSLDIVFERFAKRVGSSDANYISASLTILNKTGGDILKVFSSIEKSFFNRRKLAQELKMQTSSSSLMYKTLIIMPILIFVIIFILNPSYYVPLFTTKLGWLILFLIISIFSLYVYFMKKSLRIKV